MRGSLTRREAQRRAVPLRFGLGLLGLVATGSWGCGASADSEPRPGSGAPSACLDEQCACTGAEGTCAAPAETEPGGGSAQDPGGGDGPAGSTASRACGADGVAPASVNVWDQDDLDALEGCERIAGDLTIATLTALDPAPLLALQRVDGTLSVSGYKQSIDGVLQGFQSLVELGALQLVNSRLTSLAPFGRLRRVGPEPDAFNRPVTSIVPPSSISIENVSGLQSLEGLDSLEALASVFLSGNPDLTSLEGLERLDQLDRLTLYSSPIMTLHGLEHLRRAYEINVGGTLLTSFEGLTALEEVEYLRLTDDVTSLEGMPSLRRAGYLSVQAPALSDLRGLGSAEIGTLSLSQISAPDLGGLENLQISDFFECSGTSLLSLRGLPQLGPDSTLSVTGQALEDISALAAISRLSSLMIGDTAVRNLDPLAALTQIDTVTLAGNPELTQIDGLSNVTGLRRLDVADNPALRTLPTFANVRSCAPYCDESAFHLGVRNNASLESGPALPQIEAANAIEISSNPKLLGVSGWDGLRAVRDLHIRSNSSLQAVSLPQLQSAGFIVISDNSSLDDAPLAPLRSVSSSSTKIVSNSSGPALLSPCPWPNDGVCDEREGHCALYSDDDDCRGYQ